MNRVILFAILLLSVNSGNAAPPNIVYIISDDQTYRDFGFMGNKRVHTPNLDALAAKSLVFENGYVPTSVCRPSLVTLLTGLYPHQHGVTFNHGPPGNSGYNRMTSRQAYENARSPEFEIIRKLDTLPAWLKKGKGYRSLQTGKFWEGHWRNGGFTEGMTLFTPPEEQDYGGVRTLASGEAVAHGNGDWGLKIGRETMKPITEFISDSEKSGDPWLVWYAPYLPHQPHDSPEKYYALAKSQPDVAEHELPYFAAIAQFDDTVGELLDIVEANADSSNTLFIFVVDNGWSPGLKRSRNRPAEFDHSRESKRAPFDDGVRTPILFRWDGHIDPRVESAPVSSVDIVPTIISAIGLEKIPGTSGIDLLKKDSIDPNRAVFGEIYPGDASSLDDPAGDIAYRWVRQRNLKLIVPHFHHLKQQAWGSYLDGPALFDLVSDPEERNNLIAEIDLAEGRVRLKALLDDWWRPASVHD